MKTPLGTEVDLGLRHIVLDGDPAPPREKGTAAPLSFRPMSIVPTVAHLSYCWTLLHNTIAIHMFSSTLIVLLYAQPAVLTTGT